MSSENSKPEWFQMAEADVFPPQSRGKRAIQIMALATPLLVLGAALVFAQTQDSPTAVASAVTAAATSASVPASPSITAAPSAVATSSTPASAPTITVKKAAIATLPTSGGHDEGLRSSDDD